MYDEKRCNGELAAARNDGRAEGLAQGHDEAQVGMANKFKAGRHRSQIIYFAADLSGRRLFIATPDNAARLYLTVRKKYLNL